MHIRLMLLSIFLFTLGACDSPGQEGDACSADSDCDEGLVCHTDEHEHEGEDAEEEDDEEASVCEPEDAHEHEHDHEHE